MKKTTITIITLFTLGSSCPADEKIPIPEYDTIRPAVRLTPRDSIGIMDLLEVESYQVSFNKNYLSQTQSDNLLKVLNVAAIQKYDVYALLAIAFRESSFHNDVVSDTGDVGVFQINYRWWHKEFGYKDFKSFYQANIKVATNAEHAVKILRRFSKNKACKGDNIFACYNGGYGWRQSEKSKYIMLYRDNVVKTRNMLRVKYPQWAK